MLRYRTTLVLCNKPLKSSALGGDTKRIVNKVPQRPHGFLR
jgi:hypothetical protein